MLITRVHAVRSGVARAEYICRQTVTTSPTIVPSVEEVGYRARLVAEIKAE